MNKHPGVLLNDRHISWLISASIGAAFFIFMGGYFLGHKKALEKFSNSIEQDSFVDDSYAAMTPVDNAGAIEASDDELPRFYAQLIGFGTRKGAERFVNRVLLRGIPVEIHTRISKTTQGASCSWYQVVTQPYVNKEELDVLVKNLIQEERLHDVRIVSC